MTEPATDAPPALVYCRVSTNQLAGGTSLDTQQAACVAHARRLGYWVARVTREVFSRAELFRRPLLSRDRADIRAGRFKALVAYSVDRLTGDDAHLAILSDECERSGCRLIFVTRDAGSECPADEAYAAGVERRKIIERVQRARRAKLLAGRPAFNGFDLYGYRADRGAGVYRIHEPEAAVVRRVFRMCASGAGMYTIAKTFNREGLPSPKSAYRPGARWTSAAVSDMLNCRAYTGEEVRRIAAGDQGAPPGEPESVRLPDGVRPAIIPPELWDACQHAIRARAAKMKNKWNHPALLRGHIFCAECGARMIRNHFRRDKYEYLKYRCGSRWRPYETECRGEGVPLEAVHEWAWAKVTSLLSSPGFLEGAIADAERDEQAAQLQVDLQAARRTRDLYRQGSASAREARQLDGLIDDLGARVAEARWPVEELRRVADLCSGVGRDFNSFTFEERRLALHALRVRVRANGEDLAGWHFEAGSQRTY